MFFMCEYDSDQLDLDFKCLYDNLITSDHTDAFLNFIKEVQNNCANDQLCINYKNPKFLILSSNEQVYLFLFSSTIINLTYPNDSHEVNDSRISSPDTLGYFYESKTSNYDSVCVDSDTFSSRIQATQHNLKSNLDFPRAI